MLQRHLHNLRARIAHTTHRAARLASFDFPRFYAPLMPEFAGQIVFGVICAGASILLREVVDMILPSAGPFALTIPTVLVATLFGRFGGGLVCLVLSALYAWYYVLPVHGSFDIEDTDDGPRILVNIASGFFVVVLAELFRSTMQRAISERETLLVELEHRVKNNFASVAGMLRLQLRETENEEAKAALQSALGRVNSFADANSSLYHGTSYTGAVEMAPYLDMLCRSFQDALGPGSPIKITCEADPVAVERDRAITIGLLVNEVATNSVKHAFDEREGGRIAVRFEKNGDGYRLSVADDGNGMNDEARQGALGLKLIDALTQQAGGVFEVESRQGGGTRFVFDLSA